MNECFTDLIFRNFSVERKGVEEEGEEAEGEVSYSVSTVSSHLQIT